MPRSPPSWSEHVPVQFGNMFDHGMGACPLSPLIADEESGAFCAVLGCPAPARRGRAGGAVLDTARLAARLFIFLSWISFLYPRRAPACMSGYPRNAPFYPSRR